MSIQKLSTRHLRRQISNAALPFQTTSDLSPLDVIIGQDRAIEALEFGLEMDSSGYNIFVSGLSGTGKSTIVKNIVGKLATRKPVPDDWCYVYNFKDPDHPNAIPLEAGQAVQFREDMKDFMNRLKADFKKQFNSKDYEEQRMDIINLFNDKKRDIMEQLNEEATQHGMQVHQTPTGFHTVIVKDGKPLDAESFEALSEDEKKEIDEKIRSIEIKITETVRELTKLDHRLREKLEQLNREIATYIVTQHIEDCVNAYRKNHEVIQYLEQVKKDIIKNVNEFTGEQKEDEKERIQSQLSRKYEINVIVDNSELNGAPVIYESNPTYNNLFGSIEKKAFMGAYFTDFTLIKAGSILKANGGYLIVDAINVLKNPFVYDALKRALKTKQARIEDMAELYGYMSGSTKKPEPIPLNVKVLLIGNRYIYSSLHHYDDDFTKIFKIRADFDYETRATDENIMKYAQFIKTVSEQENLLPFHRSAVKEIINFSHRLNSSQDKLSLQFNNIVSIIRESHFWAKKEAGKLVREKHVKKAIFHRKRRHNLSEEKIHEMIHKDIIKINTSGKCVGQINGLAVYSLGDYSFGKPHRITARTYIGGENIVDIERKSRLGGKIHEKGVYILSGFFNSKFGEYIPPSFSGTLVFEQSYGMIDGDSASTAELCAIISSLAEIPIYQNYAITGAVNQMGEIQAIGGVNEKIEGFFHICQAKGLTGEQGVIIPRSNVENLMLEEDVVQAVKEKKFHLYAIDTIEDAIRLLMDLPAGKRNGKGKFPTQSVYGKIEKKLTNFARRTKEFREKINKSNHSQPSKPTKKEEIDKEQLS